MLGVNVGPPGSYKTTLLTAMAYGAYLDGRDVMANYKLMFPPSRGSGRLVPFDLLRMGDYPHLFVAISEIHKLMDSRRSMSEENIAVSHIILEARKGGCDVWGDDQSFSNVESRFKKNCGILFLMKRPYLDRDEAWAYPYDPRSMVRLREKPLRFNPVPIFPLFDTNERIQVHPIFKKKEKGEIPGLPGGTL
jgi:hypothetical protein